MKNQPVTIALSILLVSANAMAASARNASSHGSRSARTTPPVTAPVTASSTSVSASAVEVISGSGTGQACGYSQHLFISQNVAGYQQSIAMRQDYIKQLKSQTAAANDFYIQVRTRAMIDLLLFSIEVIQSGTVPFNSSQGGVSGLAEVEYPGGAFALDTDIYDSLSTAPGSLTPVMPVRGMENFNGLLSYIDDLKNPAKAAYKYEAFRAALDFANRLDRAVAAQNSYVQTGRVDFDQVPKAKRFLCEGAYPTSITKPTVAEWLEKSVYERAVYRAALSIADLESIWNQLSSAQQAELTAQNQAVGL